MTLKMTIGVTNCTYLCTPPTGLPLTSYDWDSIDIRGTDHCCTIVVVVVVVRPIMCDVTRMGLNQLFVGLAVFVSIVRQSIKVVQPPAEV